jgi:hypothetical protein
MQTLRSRLLCLILAMATGLALAATGLAHRLPTASEQALQVAAQPGAEICGQSPDGTPVGDHPCPACLAGLAMLPAPATPLAPTQLALDFRLHLPRGIAANPQQQLPGHPSRGPPLALI